MSDPHSKPAENPGLVITELRCGLGNQFFQYAVGRALASHHDVPLKMDISMYQHSDIHPAIRSYCLEKYNISAVIATKDEIDELKQSDESCFHIKRGYHAGIWQTPRRVHIQGFWLSEDYFKGIRSVLRHELTPRRAPGEAIKAIGGHLKKTGSVGLHIRRGDYLDAEQLYSLPVSYYLAAMEKLEQMAEIEEIFVFSDDVEWAREHLKFHLPATFIYGNEDYEDMWLMTQCRHHIIANSTFSWWGAWLADSPRQIVIAPRRWFRTRKVSRLIPEQWLQV